MKVKIKFKRKIKNNLVLITFENPLLAQKAKPGQFVNVRIDDSYFPLSRRPLSVHFVKNKEVGLLFKIVGKGTEKLAKCKIGEELDIIGPLGSSFYTKGYEELTIIAGGIGVAPLYFLAQKEKKKKITFLIGAKNKDELFPCSKLTKFGKVFVATEDGSYGSKGLVTMFLKKISLPQVIYACGPKGMLRKVKEFTIKNNIPAQVSIEGHLACGIGMCLGCAIKSEKGYKYICRDGPVFWMNEIEI
jgi:dihydroorotate dehydrogenase electron transfer subunit